MVYREDKNKLLEPQSGENREGERERKNGYFSQVGTGKRDKELREEKRPVKRETRERETHESSMA